jgi:hypothetical protein
VTLTLTLTLRVWKDRTRPNYECLNTGICVLRKNCFIAIGHGPRRRWVDNIMMDLGEVGWSDVDWIGLAQDRNRWRALVNSVLNLWVP